MTARATKHAIPLRVTLVDRQKLESVLHHPGLNVSSTRLPSLNRCLHKYSDGISGRTHASFVRSFSSEFVNGLVSAHLIDQRAAEIIFDSGDELLFYDSGLVKPFRSEELRRQNREGEGSSLLMTSIIWSQAYRADDDVVDQVMDHLVKWFEGNDIRSVILNFGEADVLDVLDMITDVFHDSVSWKRCANGSVMVRVMDPNQKINGGRPFLYELLKPASPPTSSITDNRKLFGRVLYEFDFDVEAAVSGCIPTWSLNPDKRGECASAQAWRKAVALDLGINLEGSKGYPTFAEIRRRITEEPSLLALW